MKTFALSIVVLIIALEFFEVRDAYQSKVGVRRNLKLLQDPIETCDPDSEFRLAKNVQPSHYQLTLRPDLVSFRFDGEVLINVTVLEPNVTKVSLHQVDLDINEIVFFAKDKGS